jgi:hypothetical protein
MAASAARVNASDVDDAKPSQANENANALRTVHFLLAPGLGPLPYEISVHDLGKREVVCFE